MDNMSKNILQNCPENDLLVKRKKMLTSVAAEIINSDDDDNVDDGMEVCKVMENQHGQIGSSSALHALGETIRNTLLEINVIREQNRERRHRELLEILTKMVQQENSKSSDTHSNDPIPQFTQVPVQDCTENGWVLERTCENDNQNDRDSSITSKEVSSKYTNILHEDQVNNQPQLLKSKNLATKNTDIELQRMRAQMLEIQRKKMEDRERKKREFT